jgi:VIT1/CCC1 family predicted Fe2+/Mn2+ transporter
MAAVAYTSGKAAKEYYNKQLMTEWEEVRTKPAEEVAEIRDIYSNMGFKGTMLNKIVSQVTSNKRVWVETMMRQELGLSPEEFAHPVRDAFVVGVAALVGSVIPLIPYLFVPLELAFWTAIGISTLALFASGAIKAKYTGIDTFKSAVEMAVVGMTAAIAGYLIGAALGALPLG